MSREVNEISSVPQTPRPNEINSHPAKTTILNEINSYPATPRPEARTPPVSTPPSQLHSPTFARSPLPQASAPRTPRTPRTPRFLRTPLGSPIRHAIVTMKGHLEELGHLTRFDPKDAWLPITESRSGNSYYAAFHTLSSGIGFQALVLPVAFTYLGWTWATIAFTVMFIWQLYTLWLLIQMHEAIPGIRYSRYMHLTESVFGPKLGKFLALIPILYLSAGISSALIIVGGSSMKLFFQLVCGNGCTSQPLTSIEWYLVFVCLATVLAQLPNLNSIAGVSLIGGTTAVLYCTLIWVLSVSKGQVAGVSYDLVPTKSTLDRVLDILNGLGIIAFAFRGHNLVLEIQSTLPSSLKHPSRVPMWKGVKVAYAIVACCLYPMAIGGFWAYGNQVPPANGLLTALVQFHMMDIPRWLLGLTVFLVIMNCLASFQIYAMPIFDIMETGYVSKHNKPCPWWRRSANRILFSGIGFLIGVAFPFLPNLGALIGGIALPITLAYPSFMWISVTKPKQRNASWYLNWVLGTIGMGLSVVLTIAALWSLIKQGVDLHFFQAAS